MPSTRRFWPVGAVLLFLAVTIPTPAARATPRLVVRHPAARGADTLEVLPPGHALTQVAGPGRVPLSRIEASNGPLRIIVKFDSEPVTSARGHDRSLALARIDRLRADLAALRTVTGSGPGGADTHAEITHEYSRVFSGAALSLSPRLLDRVRSLSYVRAVYRDDIVRANLAESVPLIHADRVKNQLGGTGQGIRVGILDTGVDYEHPAFGGGLGPGHRVAGGWDFVNDDPDPRDDQGHGTHVAGIVAGAGGGVMGVAPAATLYAFKVLNAEGWGYTSWIVAALERVLDPDENPATSDAMHVINLSLGNSSGDPNDPMSVAVDHLVEAGVVCAVAAGNWPWYFAIGSPGVSRGAITVGGSTKEDALAWFSSLGPAPGTLDLKPDLLAPGLEILSAANDGGQVPMSGTSMATPHVAGVAAQLRQLHPAWSADQVKAAMVGRCKDLGLTPFQQGAGRLDAYAAATATFTISPTHLSYGRIDGSAPTWSRRDTLRVTNLTGQPRAVSFPASVTIASGAVLTVSPTTANLPADGHADVVVRLAVDNAVTPFPPATPYGYAGAIVASSGAETHRVPASFHKAAALSVQSAGLVDWLIVHDRRPNGFVYSNSPSAGPILMPPGRYDVMASYYPRFRFVTRENLEVHGDVALSLDPSEATVRLDFANLGPEGEPAECNLGNLSLYSDGSGWGFNYIGFPFTEIWASQASASYHLEWTRRKANYRDHEMSFPGALAGIVAPRSFSNLPGELRHFTIDFPRLQAASWGPLVWDYAPDRTYGGYWGFGFFNPDSAPITGPFTFDYWFIPPPYEGHLLLGHRIDLYPWDGGPVDFRSGPIVFGGSRRLDRGWPVECYLGSLYAPRWSTFSGDRMEMLAGAPVWRGQFQNAEQTIVLSAGPELAVPHLVTDMYGNMTVEPDPAFTLSGGGTVVVSDTLRGAGGFSVVDPILQQVSAGAYDFRTSRAFTVRGRPARLDVHAHMDTRLPDRDPPSLRSFQVYANGAAADSIAFAGAPDAVVRFQMTDADTLQPNGWVRQGSQGTWQALAIERGLEDFVGQLPSALSGDIALKLEARDRSGNALTLTWDPAFVAVPGVTGPWSDGLEFALHGARPNPAGIDQLWVELSLPSRAPARVTILDVAGRRVGGQELGSLEPGRRRVRLAAPERAPSGIYFLRLEQEGRTRTARFCLLR